MNPQEPQNTNGQIASASQPKDHFKTAKKMLKAALIITGVVLAWFAIVLLIGLPYLKDHDTGGGGDILIVFLAPVMPFAYAVPILLIIALVQAILGARDKKKTSSQDNQQARP